MLRLPAWVIGAWLLGFGVGAGAAMAEETAPRKQVVEQQIAHLLPRAESGDANAQYQLAKAYSQGFCDAPPVAKWDKEAGRWFTKAAQQGHAAAQFELGTCYDTGRCGVRVDFSQAMAWFQKAADLGNANAQFALGQAYWFGIRGVAKNPGKAKHWLEQAVRGGHPSAQSLLERQE